MRTINSLPLLLLEIQETLRRLDSRIDELANTQLTQLQGVNPNRMLLSKYKVGDMSYTNIYTLFSLPDHLRKTLFALYGKGEATAEQIAQKTGRVRAVESSYLNQLYTMRHVKKRRKGRSVHFSVDNHSLGKQFSTQPP